MKVAIVHDYLIDFGGAERVLLALHKIYPSAPIYVLINRPRKLGEFEQIFRKAKITQSWFGYFPFADKLISPFRFLIPVVWKSLDLKKYDLIISSSSWAVTKGFEKKAGGVEICYCHTPPRYLYGYDTSRKFTGFLGKIVFFYALLVNHFMRQYDFDQAQKVDYFIANSKEVSARIKKFYRRESSVIYPPVEIGKEYKKQKAKENYYLTGGRLTAAKNFDLIIRAFNELKAPLLVYGSGPQESNLKNIAKNNINFLGKIDDTEMARLYSNAKGYIAAQKDEDFGITPVEAMSFGTPVIAYRGGGYLETVIEGKTGIFFDNLTVESISAAVKKFEKTKFNFDDCINRSEEFSEQRFIKEIKSFINKHA